MENISTSKIDRYGGCKLFEKKNNLEGCIEMLKVAIREIEELKEQGKITRIENLELIVSNPMLGDELDSIGYKFVAEVKESERE